jgi:murein DD-endopeptidase MepM/ murein hydrolase activator NlpD
MIHFESFEFHPVIVLPPGYEVYDLTQTRPSEPAFSGFGIGRYNEKRSHLYTNDLFKKTETGTSRDIHMGLDIGAPAGTPIYAFYEGQVFMKALHLAPGDYGPTLLTVHQLGGQSLYALWGHLQTEFFDQIEVGESFKKGEMLARVGSQSENGGWPPHLHFQLCLEKPQKADLPGVVAAEDLAEALQKYPDPRLVLGKLY